MTLRKKIEKSLGDFLIAFFQYCIIKEEYPVERIDHNNIHNILVILRHQMGDMLCAIPMLRSLKSFYPDSHLILITKDSTNYEKIFTGVNSVADEVISYEYGFENFMKLVKELRGKHIDLAVVPSTVVFSATNHLIAYFSKAKIRVGVSSINNFDNKTSYLLNIKKDFLWETKKVHQIERNLDIIRQINILPVHTRIKIAINKVNSEFAGNFVAEHFPRMDRHIIGIHPGAAKEDNIWKTSNFAELANILYTEFNCYIFISVGPHDTRISEDLKRILHEKYNIRDLASHRGILMNNMGIINLTSLFITNDTGVMHLASGLDIPVVALFGPTNACDWGPIGENKVSVQSTVSDINDITVENISKICSRFLGSQISKNVRITAEK